MKRSSFNTVSSTELQIERRYRRLAGGGSAFGDFMDSVRNDPKAKTGGVTHPLRTPNRSEKQKLYALLKTAAAACFAVDNPANAPMYLGIARHCCKTFDRRYGRFHMARVKGGLARQAKLECARVRAARLVRTKAPPEGWKSAWQAARVICPHLALFVRSRSLSMTTFEGAVRTVVRWIREHPACKRAFAATAAQNYAR